MNRSLARWLGAAALAVLLVATWQAQHAFQFEDPRDPGGKRLVAGALALAVLTLALRRLAGTTNDDPTDSDFVVRYERPLVAALCGVGALYQFVHFGSVPTGMNHDAAFNGQFAHAVWSGEQSYTPYINAAWGRETLFMYIVAAFMPIFGTSPELIQFAGSLCAVAALLPMYLLARAMFGRRFALIALGFFAFSGWHGVFGRTGWRVVTVPPFEMLALWGVWRATESRRPLHWAITGLACAVAINTYNAGRAVPPIVAVLGLLLAARRRVPWRESLSGAAVAFAVFIAAGAPMLWFAYNNFEQWQSRALHLVDERSANERRLRNFGDALAMFNYRAGGNDFFIEEPLLEPLPAVLFTLGGAVVLTRFLDTRGLFIVVGFLLSLVPGIVSSPNGNRCITAMPFVYLTIALGGWELARLMGRLISGKRAEAAATALVALFVAAAGAESYRQFIGPNRRDITGYDTAATAAGEFIRPYMKTHKIYVVSGNWPEHTLIYLSFAGDTYPYELPFLHLHSFADLEPNLDRAGRKPLLIVTSIDEAGLDAYTRLRKLFADHRVEDVRARRANGDVMAHALFVEPSSLAKTGLWSNSSRAVFLQGKASDQTPRARLCFDPIRSPDGLATRIQWMVPAIAGTGELGRIAWLSDCAGERGKTVATFALTAEGLTAVGTDTRLLVPAREIQAGHWYEITATFAPDDTITITVDGRKIDAADGLKPAGSLAAGITAVELSGDRGGSSMFVDSISVVAAPLDASDPRWTRKQRDKVAAFDQDFESMPFGPLRGGEWRGLAGSWAIAGAPAEWKGAGGSIGGENVFDGGKGTGPGQFNEPVGVAVDGRGNLYVTDRLNHRLQKFSADGMPLAVWGREGEQPGQFKEPLDVAIDSDFVFVADTWNQRVQVLDPNGNFVFEVREPPLSSPRGIDARHDKIYLADTGNGVVRVFDRSGKLLQSLGEKGGDGPGHLNEPTDVVADSRGNLYVVNGGSNRIEVFDASGATKKALPVAGWTGGNLKESYITIDAQDVLYLTDWDAHRVRRFRTDGTELTPIGPEMQQPCGVALFKGRAVVAARAEQRLRVVPIE